MKNIVIGIYKITCLGNKKIYIGSTVNFDKRKKEHWRALKGNYHKNQYLQSAWNKYGESAFKIELVEVLENKDLILAREQKWIEQTRCCDHGIGFNISPTAGGTYGYLYTEEQRKNCSKWVRSEECREKIRLAKLGTRHSKEAREKMSATRSGSKNIMYGKHRTDTEKRKISNTRKERGIGRGSEHNKAKLTESDIPEIRKLFAMGLTATEIAKRYNVSKSTTARINRRLLWTHV